MVHVLMGKTGRRIPAHGVAPGKGAQEEMHGTGMAETPEATSRRGGLESGPERRGERGRFSS